MLKQIFPWAALALLLWSNSQAIAQDKPPTEEDFYPLVSLDPPNGVMLEAGATELLPDNKIAVSSRRGDIYIVSGAFEAEPAPQFTLFASGLHEVLGLAWRDGWLYVTQRCEVSRLMDLDGDGRADRFETVSDGWGINGDYHEYAFGSPFDREGNIWVTLCLTGSFTAENDYRGFCLRVSPDGKTTPTCSGLRSPGGVGMNDAGDMFYTDNQGPWNGTCGLKHLKPGGFMGNPMSYKFYDLAKVLGPQPVEPKSGSRIQVERARVPELVPTAVMFPYKKMGQSASGIATDDSEGKFGPFAGQMFVGDQTFSTVMRVYLEKVNGVYQGVCFPFREGIGSGTLSLRMSPTGAMFVGGTNRGWGSRGGKPASLERLTWSGKTPFEIHQMRIQPDGFELRFTQPVDKAAAAKLDSYKLQTYTYIYQASYGSPEVDHTEPKVTSATVSEDGLRVKLVIDGLQLGHVHELHATGVRSAAGLPLLHAEAYYTLNEIPAPPAVGVRGKQYVTPVVKFIPPQGATEEWTGQFYFRQEGEERFSKKGLGKLVSDEKPFANEWLGVVPAEATQKPFEYYMEFSAQGQQSVTIPADGTPIKVRIDGEPPTKVNEFTAGKVSDVSVELAWQPATDDVELAGYRLYRGDKEGFECTESGMIVQAAADARATKDVAPLAGTKAWYALQAVDAAGQTGPPVYLAVAVPENRPPTNSLKLDAVAAGKKVFLRWSGELEPDITSIEVLRGEGAAGELKPLATIADVKQATFVDDKVQTDTDYRYALQLRDRGKLASELGPPQLVRPGLFLKRINCGGEEFVGADGIVWEADTERLPGSNRWIVQGDIQGAGDLAKMYQSERWSNDTVTYKIPVEPGKYRVTFYLSETNRNFQAAGKREFDILIDRERRFQAVDVFAAAGGYKPHVLSADVFAIDETIQIDLKKVKLGPAIKGLEIRGLPEAAAAEKKSP